MTAGRLKSITLTDFRSIRGTISVPLDAPIVLVHGANGAGKTSLLSAIELALSGQVASLGRVDPDYAKHLVHKEAAKAQISIETTGLERNEASLSVADSQVTGKALLTPQRSRFYTERCFLAQSSLGRLLELYQDSAKRSDSALTRFVKDLLGLDHLDAVIDGLHHAGDVRRLRDDVPGYAETRDGIPQVEGEIERLDLELERTDLRIEQLQQKNADLEKALTSIGDRVVTAPTAGEDEERELLRLTSLRRDVEAALLQWRKIAGADATQDRAAAQPVSEAADLAASQWNATKGNALNLVLARLHSIFPDLPSSSGGPQAAHGAALSAARDELRRCRELLAKDESDGRLETEHEGDLTRGRARVQALEQQIAGLATGAGALAQALSAVLPVKQHRMLTPDRRPILTP